MEAANVDVIWCSVLSVSLRRFRISLNIQDQNRRFRVKRYEVCLVVFVLGPG